MPTAASAKGRMLLPLLLLLLLQLLLLAPVMLPLLLLRLFTTAGYQMYVYAF
jgi:hypothetical protein